jgi:hypothetical protein
MDNFYNTMDEYHNMTEEYHYIMYKVDLIKDNSEETSEDRSNMLALAVHQLGYV